MTDQIIAKFECSTCGPSSIKYDEQLGDAAPVFCASCGADFQTTYGEVIRTFKTSGKKVADNALKNIFKGTGWKIR